MLLLVVVVVFSLSWLGKGDIEAWTSHCKRRKVAIEEGTTKNLIAPWNSFSGIVLEKKTESILIFVWCFSTSVYLMDMDDSCESVIIKMTRSCLSNQMKTLSSNVAVRALAITLASFNHTHVDEMVKSGRVAKKFFVVVVVVICQIPSS